MAEKIITTKKCDWGCGKIAKYFFSYSKKYCCGNNVSKCPEKNKKMVNTRKNNNSYKFGAIKGLQTKRTTFGISGKTIEEEAAIKSSKTKTKLDENGNTIAKLAAEKMVKTRRKIIDSKTGLDLCKLVGKKQKETKDNIIDPETGLNMHQIIGQRALTTNLIKDKNGKNHFDRIHEKRKTDIDSFGMDYYARRTLKLLKDIDYSGLNAIERAHKKAFLRKKYKNTNIHYQGSYELNFLELLEEKHDIEWLVSNIKNGTYIKYWNPISNTYRHYIPDFIINDNCLYEIKSSYTWNRCGSDEGLENINKAKLASAIQAGFNVMLVLDKEEIKWK